MNFFRGEGAGMTVEGEPANDAPAIQIDRNEAARVFGFFIITAFQVLASQANLPTFAMSRVLEVYTVQLQVG